MFKPKPKIVPKKKPIETFVEPKDEIVLPEIQEVLRCECGEPVAPGQDQVCQDHIRTN